MFETKTQFDLNFDSHFEIAITSARQLTQATSMNLGQENFKKNHFAISFLVSMSHIHTSWTNLMLSLLLIRVQRPADSFIELIKIQFLHARQKK